MLLSLNWLKDFVNIPKNITPEELGLRLTMHTVEIDGIEKQGENLDGVVVGEILEIKNHPNANKLSIAQVDVGENDFRQIIFGQMLKIKIGQKMPVALAPTVLPNGQEIKKTKLRGETSEGMFCLDQELGLLKEGVSARFFDKSIKNGTSVIKALGLDDVIYEVDNKSITNRPDLWGHYGMAREIAAFLNIDMIDNKFSILNFQTNFNFQFSNKSKIQNPQSTINAQVEDQKLCPRYMAIAMNGIKIQDSQEWIQKRLMAVGMRPINNIVDITNYVMLELGQPTHAFDFGKIKGKFPISNFQFPNNFQFPISNFKTNSKAQKNNTQIIIRNAKQNEIIKTLDGVERKLDESMLVIADEKKPIAIAGVMGGVNSEVDDKTNSILIESANFNAISVRKTAQKLGLRTEASMRFEKSLDPNLCEIALARIVELIKETCTNANAKIISNLADEKNFDINQKTIQLDLDWLNKRIGQEIKENRVVEILESLGFGVEINKNEKSKKKNKKININTHVDTKRPTGYLVSNPASIQCSSALSVCVPTWRAKDISIPEDIVEEVARIYGYNNLKPEMPVAMIKAPKINQEKALEREIKNILSQGAGLTEVYNYSFVGEKQLDKLGISLHNYIQLANPIVSQHTMLRQSLIPNLLDNIKLNQAKYENIKLFEIGNVFLNFSGALNKSDKNNDKLPHQENTLGIILANNNEANNFSKLKGIVEFLLDNFDLQVEFKETKFPNNLKAGNSAFKLFGNLVSISVQNYEIGFVSRFNKNIGQKLGIKKQVAIAEISLKKLFNIIKNKPEKKYQEIPKYPPVIRDLAFVVDNKILYNNIKKEIVNFDKLIVQVDLFDIYQGEKLGKNKKNLAFHIKYQSLDKTLTAEEADEIQKKLIKNLENKFQARVRDF
ncbi:MAG: phenylalanine--tRNA ligase subunit beta [Patescibacteria group bacterium]